MSPASDLKVAVIGGSGYSGRELLRLLLRHPGVTLAAVGSSSNAGKPVGEIVPELAHRTSLAFSDPSGVAAGGHDAVFFATPEGVASELAPLVLESGGVVIDIGPDFRLRDPEEWSRWYGMEHKAPELLARATYGLPEAYRERIRGADVIANPGCYPTCALLPLRPLVASGSVKTESVVIDAKSGVTGAGRKTGRPDLLYAEIDGNLSAYKVDGHRHRPEIRAVLEDAASGPVRFSFVPHLIPMSRGMMATIYVEPEDGARLRAVLDPAFEAEPFVRLEPEGRMPPVARVRGTNDCVVGLHQPPEGPAVIVSVIDNLGKGAAGQAVQNMNIRFGLGETCGLEHDPS